MCIRDRHNTLLCVFIMFTETDMPAECEMWFMIHFLNVSDIKPVEIHYQIYKIDE